MAVSGLEKRMANLQPFQPGENWHVRRRAFELAKLDALKREYNADGTLSDIDVDRLLLAAKHFTFAHFANDANVAVRSTRAAEMLLAKVRKPEQSESRSVPNYIASLSHD